MNLAELPGRIVAELLPGYAGTILSGVPVDLLERFASEVVQRTVREIAITAPSVHIADNRTAPAVWPEGFRERKQGIADRAAGEGK